MPFSTFSKHDKKMTLTTQYQSVPLLNDFYSPIQRRWYHFSQPSHCTQLMSSPAGCRHLLAEQISSSSSSPSTTINCSSFSFSFLMVVSFSFVSAFSAASYKLNGHFLWSETQVHVIVNTNHLVKLISDTICSSVLHTSYHL